MEWIEITIKGEDVVKEFKTEKYINYLSFMIITN